MKMRQKEQIVYGDKRKTGRADCILLCVCIGFYLLFPLFDGPVWCVDSGGYADMHVSREPLYPVFLAFCRWSEGFIRLDWKITAVILQSLLAGFATWFSGYAIGRMKHHSRMIRVLTILCQFAVTLLCRFVAKRGSAYSDCILTEGLGFSLFLLFTVHTLFKALTDFRCGSEAGFLKLRQGSIKPCCFCFIFFTGSGAFI